MIWVVLMACGQPETAAEADADAAAKSEAPEGVADDNTKDWPTADQILLAHNQATSQCDLLTKKSYKISWKATMNDGHQAPSVEEIVHQGAPGFSYTRIHQRREPSVRFVAFGRTPKGKFWSASDGGIQADLPEEMAASLMSGMDPTPVCNFEKRWPTRTLLGPEDRDGVPTWRVRVSWADGTGTDLWFHRDHRVLVASSAKAGNVDTTTELAEYGDFDGIRWPKQEVASRAEGPLEITTTQVLQSLEVEPESFRELGPTQIAAVLAANQAQQEK